jgi:hypothetical protein
MLLRNVSEPVLVVRSQKRVLLIATNVKTSTPTQCTRSGKLFCLQNNRWKKTRKKKKALKSCVKTH